FGRERKIGKDRCRMQVGERQGRSGKPGVSADEPFECVETSRGTRQRCGYALFITSAALGRGADSLDEDVPDHGAIGVAVDEANDLRLTGSAAWRLRLQGRP